MGDAVQLGRAPVGFGGEAPQAPAAEVGSGAARVSQAIDHRHDAPPAWRR